eukprot:4473800-Pleurochrysis_carterae.AAC.1
MRPQPRVLTHARVRAHARTGTCPRTHGYVPTRRRRSRFLLRWQERQTARPLALPAGAAHLLSVPTSRVARRRGRCLERPSRSVVGVVHTSRRHLAPIVDGSHTCQACSVSRPDGSVLLALRHVALSLETLSSAAARAQTPMSPARPRPLPDRHLPRGCARRRPDEQGLVADDVCQSSQERRGRRPHAAAAQAEDSGGGPLVRAAGDLRH